MVCCVLLGMRLRYLVWRRGRRDEELKIAYCFSIQTGLWVPKECLPAGVRAGINH